MLDGDCYRCSMSAAETTTEQVIEILTAAGFDYHDFKCEAAANRYNTDRVIAARTADHPANLWASIAEMARKCSDADFTRAWGLAGMPIPDEYLVEDEAA